MPILQVGSKKLCRTFFRQRSCIPASCMLSLRNLVSRYMLLPRTFKPIDIVRPQLGVLCAATLHPFPPHSKTAGFHFAAHDFDNFLFGYTKLKFDGLKGRSVFPGHFDDSVKLTFCEFFLHRYTKIRICFAPSVPTTNSV